MYIKSVLREVKILHKIDFKIEETVVMSKPKTGAFMTDIKNTRDPLRSLPQKAGLFSSKNQSLPKLGRLTVRKSPEKDIGVFYQTYTAAVSSAKKNLADSWLKKKVELRKFENVFTEKFLEGQKQKVEGEIDRIYKRPINTQSSFKLKSTEKNAIFVEMIDSQQNELLKLKKTFNELEVKLRAEEKSNYHFRKMMENFDDPESYRTREEQLLENKSAILESLSNGLLELEVLENTEKHNKLDLILIKKKNEIFKRWASDIRERTHLANKDLEKENANYMVSLRHSPAIRQQEKPQGMSPFIGPTVKEEFSIFLENIQASKVIKEEERKILQIRQMEEESLTRELEAQNLHFKTEINEQGRAIETLEQKLERSNSQLADVMAIIRASSKASIVDEIYEAYSSREALDQLNENYLKDSQAKKTNASRFPLILLLSNEDREAEASKVTLLIKKHVNQNLVLEELEGQIRERNTELELLNLRFARQNDHFLQASAVFSRLLFQISPSTAKVEYASANKLLDVMTFIGLQLERIMNICHQEGGIGHRDLSLDDGEAMNKNPYDFLRLQPAHISSSTLQDLEI